uniref:Uncharacterized protein n=1 Tax=viral metagenome TaxID=1070528 RepID=A0A6H1ZGB1_9ZZZZ
MNQISEEELEEFKQECLSESEYYDHHCKFLSWVENMNEQDRKQFLFMFGTDEVSAPE